MLKAALIKENIIVSATEYVADFTANGGSITGNISWPGKSVKDEFIIGYRSVGYDYVKTIGATLIEGVDFSRNLPSEATSGLLINAAAAKMMALKNPVGTPIKFDGVEYKVIGVVNDYNNVTVSNRAAPTIFYYEPTKTKSLLMRLNPSQPLNVAIEAIGNISQELNPAYPPGLKYISDGMEKKIKSEKLLGVLSNIFGSFAILISCLGLLGLALYMAEQRKREISIRKVLGADLKSILMLLNKDFIKLVLLSNVIAIPIAYMLLTNWLRTYDYKVSTGLWPYVMAAGISLTIAVLTISMQSFKVAKANPVDALKYE